MPRIMVSLLVSIPMLVSSLSSSQALTRRQAATAASAALFGSRKMPSRAAAPPATVFAKGIVKNDPNCMGLTCSGLTPMPPNGALYISLRPARNDAAVRPVATARFAGPITFPYEWAFSSADLTPEYSGMDASALTGDLTISVRFDDDGILSTNGPDDLVGRGTLRKRGSSEPGMWEPAVVALQGRGYAGRISTSGK